jgi:NADPH:quinone reductase-like Zn-dependent oxidoreductase
LPAKRAKLLIKKYYSESYDMKAAVIHKHGGLECLNVEDVPEPKPKEGEVVLKVNSAALNHLDIWVRKSRAGLDTSKPHILGSDAAGIIVDKGPNTNEVNIGDEVILNPGLSCGRCEYCRRGEQSECITFGIIGMNRDGTFAEKVAVPLRNVWPKPAHMDFDEAASIGLVYQTAWRMLYTRARLRSSQVVLIHGIGGGVALACLQFAKLAGAEVIVTSASQEKLSKALQAGADYIVNYKKNGAVTEEVKDITGGRGVDIVIDSVGAATWDTDFAAVRKGGYIVLCGVTSGSAAQTNLQGLYWNQLNILGSTMGSDEDFRQMLKAVNTSKMIPAIDSIWPLEDIKEATGRMENAGQYGKIVLRISDGIEKV